MMSYKSKILTRDALAKLRRKWADQGEKVVFTNGCFDIVHRGHVDYLNKAAELGTKLIVAVNTDQSVSKIKGPSRPIQDEISRTELLASMGCVDAVVLFDEPTPYELINAIIPDVLVKGSDYKAEDIVGYDIVTSYGGTVQTLDFIDGYSSSAIIQKILKG
jgi:rfaE bifunctional protein nucleotidyltransferase chain/domain